MRKLKVKEIVDAIGVVKSQIASLEIEEKSLVDKLKDLGDGAYEGYLFRCTISTYEQGRLNKQAVIAKLGEAWVAKNTTYNTITKCNCVARTGQKVTEAA